MEGLMLKLKLQYFDHLIFCHPLFLLPSTFPSIKVFSNESTLCMRWPKYWSFSFNISPSNEHPGLISFRMDWLDLLAAQGPCSALNRKRHLFLPPDGQAHLRSPCAWCGAHLTPIFHSSDKLCLTCCSTGLRFSLMFRESYMTDFTSAHPIADLHLLG